MNESGKTVFAYLSTVLLLSLILWVLGSISRSMLLPGLPISSLMAIIPVVAAIITGSRNSSLSYIPTVIVQLGDVTKIRNRLWIIPAVFLNPLIFFGNYIVLQFCGYRIPGITAFSTRMLIAFGAFIAAAYTEELGWTGFLLPIIQRQKGWVFAGIVIGVFHSVWHYIPFVQAGRSITWIMWQTLYLTSIRIVLIWLYRHSGEIVFIAAIFHASINVSWQLFPVHGSYYEPAITATISIIIAMVLIMIDRWFRR